MTSSTSPDLVALRRKPSRAGTTSRELVRSSDSKELFFAVVGHVGSGTSEVAQKLKVVLEGEDAGPAFDVEILKARVELTKWDEENTGLLSEAGTVGTMADIRGKVSEELENVATSLAERLAAKDDISETTVDEISRVLASDASKAVAAALSKSRITKARDLKDKHGEYQISKPEWKEPVHLGQLSYVELEARLAELEP